MTSSWTRALAIVALACGVYALAVSTTAVLDSGISVDATGSRVLSVDPQEYGWSYGVRPEDRVVSVNRADQAGGASITVIDGTGELLDASERGPEVALRLTTPLALAAIVVALAGFRLAARGGRHSGGAVAASLALAALPLYLADPSAPSAGVVLLGVVAPPAEAAASATRNRPLAAGWLAVAVAVGAAWAAVRLAHASTLLPLGTAAAWLTIAGAVVAGSRSAGVTRQLALRMASRTRFIDVAVIVVAAMIGVSLATVEAPFPATLAASLLPIAIYAPARRGIARLADRLVLADVRERESIRATEEERARIAREIHDDPLQAIAGVIRSLDDPAADRAEARESLREVATRLRTVATDLRPPVLDDLGLVPAIEDACRRAAGIEVTAAVENSSGYGSAGRPPAEVELAAFRIVQEALANAAKHAPGSRVSVSGSVAQASIALEVADDGPGMSPARAGDALADGRLGLPSMRRRAEAIGAELAIESRPGRTAVRLRWSA